MKRNTKNVHKKPALNEIENIKNLEVYMMHSAQKTMLHNFIAQMRKKHGQEHDKK